MIIGFDLDGTLLQTWTSNPLPGAKERLRALPAGTKTFIATNQAGPVFRAVLGDPKYPTVEDVARRIADGLAALEWRPDLLLMSVEPPPDKDDAWHEAAWAAQDEFAERWQELFAPLHTMVATGSASRKPGPAMLHTAMDYLRDADMIYIGDMDSDQQAARRAAARFVWARDWLSGEL